MPVAADVLTRPGRLERDGASSPLASRRIAAATPRERARVDIQALRALAVGLVVAYHLDASRVPGGYVGVDVFFVISGFLITSHLTRSVLDGGSLSLLGFYARRIRRLLPAALTVLVVTGIGIFAVVPPTLWSEFGHQIIASSSYFENWALAFNATQYSAPTADVSPVQHFWSLSTEEQFYLCWPFLIVVTVALASKLRIRRRLLVTIALALLVITSLTCSIVLTAQEPGAAYFSTLTRAWEFGAGGLLAVTFARVPKHRGFRVGMAWGGLGLIVAVAFVFNASTPFPGWTAALPVMGTLAVIAANDVRGGASPNILFKMRPVQYLGDISYSTYLWHWPIFILLPYAFAIGHETKLRVLTLALTLVLASLSKRFIEDRYRAASPTSIPPRRPSRPLAVVGAMALAVTLVATLGGSLNLAYGQQASDARLALARSVASPPHGFGAASAPDGALQHAATIVPSPLIAVDDAVGYTAAGAPCQDTGKTVVPAACSWGSTRSDAVRVAIVGDSHAAHWSAAAVALTKKYNWRVTLLSHSGCPLNLDSPVFPAAEQTAACRAWLRNSLGIIEHRKFDVVLVAALAGLKYTAGNDRNGFDSAVAGFERTWGIVEASGAKVVAIRDNPDPATAGIADPDSCVALHMTSLQACSFDRTAALPDDALATAASASGRPVVDLTSSMCDASRCPSVIGGVLVYRDRQHLTSTFARTLAPALDRALHRDLPPRVWSAR